MSQGMPEPSTGWKKQRTDFPLEPPEGTCDMLLYMAEGTLQAWLRLLRTVRWGWGIDMNYLVVRSNHSSPLNTENLSWQWSERCSTAGFEDRKRPQAKRNAGSLQKLERQRNVSLLEPPKKNAALLSP